MADEGLFLKINGVIYVDRYSRESRNKAKEKIIRNLNLGKSILMFPEATWNFSENQVVLPFRHGIIEISRKTQVPILPIAIELIDDKYIIKFGKPIYCKKDISIQEEYHNLRDQLATMKWNILEKKAYANRNDMDYYDWVKYRLNRIREFPKETFTNILGCVYKF